MVRTLLKNRIQSLCLAAIAVFFALCLVLYPEEAFRSSLRGLKIWWEVVFPALLPFFITAEILLGFGVVHFLGVILEPLMRPVFRVPGVGGFVMAVALVSGNPMGAKLTARLREQRLLTREEGERLVSFTSTAGPLFIFGAVGVGFFESTSVGLVLAIAHYLSAILVGVLMRFWEPSSSSSPLPVEKRDWLPIRALRAMHRARLMDGRSLGQLIGDAVSSAIQTQLMIGGFIITFSVIVHVVAFIGAQGIGLGDQMETLIAGVFEITLGSQMVSEHAFHLSLLGKLTLVSMFLGWNGLSIHAQVVSMISRTQMRYTPYLLAKLCHSIIAGVITLLIWKPMQPYLHDLPLVIPTFGQKNLEISLPFWHQWQGICSILAIIGLVLILTSTNEHDRQTR